MAGQIDIEIFESESWEKGFGGKWQMQLWYICIDTNANGGLL